MADLSGPVTASPQAVGSVIIQLNVHAQTIKLQPSFPTPIAVPELAAINTQLQTAQDHAEAWLTDYSGKLWDRLQTLLSFGQQFDELFPALSDLATKIGTESAFQPNQISQLVSMIAALQSLVQAQLDESKTTFGVLTKYSSAVQADYQAFLADFNTANIKLGGDTGEIARLTEKIQAEHDAMSKDLAMIGGGAAMMIVGILVICCGALLEFATAGTSTVLIVGGVAVVAGGAAMTGVAGKDYDDKMAQIAIDEQTLAADNHTIAQLKGILPQFANLGNTLTQAEGELQNLITGWQELDNSISAVISDLQSPEDWLATLQKTDPSATPATVGAIVGAELSVANSDWAAAVKLAQSYLDKGRQILYVQTTGLPTQQAIVDAAVASGNRVALRRVRALAESAW